ncbi:Hsp70 family protein [Cognatishimia activa]|uniref:Hsp70 family protein n=1 Tax=Cognatishimia activa TaxID=1715691 RepID=UPI00222E8E15|nr:Hsp70 family protein [Cognatishimia activa]UZD91065.1 Hsp70 family protein [Cognatishimia activa]
MSKASQTLGIDFGTSNSAAAFVQDGEVRFVEMAPGSNTLPTSFFFDFESRETLIGHPADRALLNGDEGRYMRALKRVLGTGLMHEKRQLLNKRLTFVDIIGDFLKRLKTQAEAATGQAFDRVVSGRPVVFHGLGDPREQQAEDDLRLCYEAAGFKDVRFMAEPQAAALASGAKPGLGLIVDIGGGTSDFTVFHQGANGEHTVLANHGVRIGGTDFDQLLSIANVMPLLGKGTELRREFGPGTTPVPINIFHDLATWEKIPFLYTAQTRRKVSDMAQLAVDGQKINRLETVLEDELGHDLAFAVEAGKVSANSGSSGGVIDLFVIEKGLQACLTRAAMDDVLINQSDKLKTGAMETLALAQKSPDQIDQVIYVGGSSLMGFVSDAMKTTLPNAEHVFTEVFTAVVKGLALATQR